MNKELIQKDQPSKTPLEELKRSALEHYEDLAKQCHHWNSFIPAAIAAYNPSTEAPLQEVREIPTLQEYLNWVLDTPTFRNYDEIYNWFIRKLNQVQEVRDKEEGGIKDCSLRINGKTMKETLSQPASNENPVKEERKRMIAFLIWKSEKGYYAQGATRRTTNDDAIWIRQENQLCFSPPISSNKLYELWLKENPVKEEGVFITKDELFELNLGIGSAMAVFNECEIKVPESHTDPISIQDCISTFRQSHTLISDIVRRSQSEPREEQNE